MKNTQEKIIPAQTILKLWHMHYLNLRQLHPPLTPVFQTKQHGVIKKEWSFRLIDFEIFGYFIHEILEFERYHQGFIEENRGKFVSVKNYKR